MADGREDAHVESALGDQHLRRALADARDGAEQLDHFGVGRGVLLDPVGTTVQNPIDFGAAEGLILNPIVVVLGPTMTLNGPISGTGGLTLSSNLLAISMASAYSFFAENSSIRLNN